MSVSVDPAGRLFDLLDSFSTLRGDGKVLLKQIRGSLEEMRQLRSQLRNNQNGLSRPAPNGAGVKRKELRLRYRLTPREGQVALLLSEGRSNSAIARELEISGHTARHHTQRILSKLAVHSRGEAAARIRG